MPLLAAWPHVVFEYGLIVALRSKGHESRDEAAEERRNMNDNNKARATL